MKRTKGQWLNAFIEATRAHRTDNAPITSGMLAAQGTNRSLLSPLNPSYQEWQYQITHDGLDEVDATIIRLAVDGLWLSEIFGISAIDEEMREKVIERLKMQIEKLNKLISIEQGDVSYIALFFCVKSVETKPTSWYSNQCHKNKTFRGVNDAKVVLTAAITGAGDTIQK